MSSAHEQNALLQSVRHWFDHDQQLSQYADTATAGLTQAEAWLLQPLTAPGHVLDLGCGAGRATLALANHGHQITAIDISVRLLLAAKQIVLDAGESATFVQTGAPSLPFRRNTFDAATAFKVYCYIPTRALRLSYLREIYRTLKAGACLFITQHVTPEESIGAAYDETYRMIAPNYTILEAGDTFTSGAAGGAYVHWFTERELACEYEQSGFAVELFESDSQHGGEGHIIIARLRKATS